MSVCVLHPNVGCLIQHCALFCQNASGVYVSGLGPWEVSPASSRMLWIMTRPHLAICLGTVEEVEQLLSEDLDHGALVMDITLAAESDHLTQELWSKLETSDLPLGWEWLEGQLWFQGCLYIPDQEILCLQVIRNHHDHPAAGHFREARTSKLICRSFHWLGL